MDRQEQTGARQVDSALASLVAAARIFGIPADMEQLKRAYAVPPSGMDSLTLVRAAKDLGLKAKWRAEAPTEELFRAIPLPAIFVLSGGLLQPAIQVGISTVEALPVVLVVKRQNQHRSLTFDNALVLEGTFHCEVAGFRSFPEAARIPDASGLVLFHFQ